MACTLMLFLSILAALCYERSEATVLCGNNLLPGITKLSYSVDVTQLDLLPKDLAEFNGFKTPIIDFTCEKGNTFTNTYNGVTYSVPDQILRVVMNPGGRLNAETKIYNTTLDVQKSLGAEVNLNVNTISYGSFTGSSSYKRSENTFQNHDKFISSADAFVAGFRADVDYHWNRPFNNHILHYIENMLPDNYITDPKKYQQFIDIYGTHYFSIGTFGGRLRLEITTSNDLRKIMTDQQIKANVEASYLTFLSAKGAVDHSNKHVNESFLNLSQNKSYYYGGMVNLLDENNSWRTWWDTVASNPWLYGGQLSDIDEVLPEGSSKKASIKLAVKSYMITKALPTYFTRLDTFIRKNKYGLDRAHELHRQLTNLMVQTTPLDPVVSETLLEAIEAYINPPKVWLDNTKLCYGCPWEDVFICPTMSIVCTGVNEYESAGRGDYFSSSFGSSSIGLFSPPPLAWFNDTRICYEWLMPNRGGYQLCASPNTYTADLSSHPGYVNNGLVPIELGMVFLFESREVPGWFLNTRLCGGYSTSDKKCVTIGAPLQLILYDKANPKLSLETDFY